MHFRATVERVDDHGDGVVSYTLRADRRLPRFVPGQFVHLALDRYDPAGFWPESRVFSVANSVADRFSIQLTVSRKGPYTTRIVEQLEPGTVVWAKGPYGDFAVGAAAGARDAVLVAGGTGITPFCAFMDAAISAGRLPVESATLHYGARTPELLIYRELADRCAAAVPGFSVRYYAEGNVADADPAITAGSLDIARIVAETVRPSETAFYLSGPQGMIRSFQGRLITDHGVDPSRVLIDAWE